MNSALLLLRSMKRLTTLTLYEQIQFRSGFPWYYAEEFFPTTTYDSLQRRNEPLIFAIHQERYACFSTLDDLCNWARYTIVWFFVALYYGLGHGLTLLITVRNSSFE